MLEIPEAYTISRQLKREILGEEVVRVVANASPHKLVWFFQNPDDYEKRLQGRVVTDVKPLAGQVEIHLENMRLTLGDGVSIRLFKSGDKIPEKHQLLIELGSAKTLLFAVQMYGGIMTFQDGENQNPYYLVAGSKPSPLTDDFSLNYFQTILDNETKNPSLKALLATEQRIPGLGNGVLQDILFNACLNPKCKLKTLSLQEIEKLYHSIKNTLNEMAQLGGRDTEKDIYGMPGGYSSILSQRTHKKPCRRCGDNIHKDSYMGGSIYYCSKCQPLV